MNNVLKKSAKEILNISEKNPELLFSKMEVRLEYKLLAQKWHPDVSKIKNSSDVFTHIGVLYRNALNKIENDSWEIPGLKEFTAIDGKKYRIRYRYSYKFELGTVFIGNKVIVYFIKKEYNNLYKNGKIHIERLQNIKKSIKNKIGKLLPSIKQEIVTNEYNVLVLNKEEDYVPLQCLLSYFKGKIPAKHVAWIISRLHNFLCLFEIIGINHNNISIKNCLVNYKTHSIIITGGWWYTKFQGEDLKFLAKDSFALLSEKMKREKISDKKLDFDSLRLIGRTLLGDHSGTSLLRNKDIPINVVNWFILPHSKNAIENFKNWQEEVLVKTWGERKFIKLDIPITEVYNFK